MRLLLQKQKCIKEKLHSNKKLCECLSSTVQNIVSKKCILNYRNNSFQKRMIIFSTIQTQNPVYSFKIEVEVNFLELLVIYKACPLKNSQILTINSKELRINFLQAFLQKGIDTQKLFTVRVGKQNGQIILQKKIGYSKRIFQSTSQMVKEVQFRVKELIEVSLKSLNHILMEINETTKKTQELKQYKKSYTQKIKRHIYYSCYDLGLSQKASQHRYPNQQIMRKREKIIKNLLGKNQRKDEPHQAMLYGLVYETNINNKQWRKQFDSEQHFQKLLQVPTLKATADQNIYIYNEIQIEMSDKAVVKDLMDTPNSKLKLLHAPVTYLLNKQNPLVKKQSKMPFMNKQILIKGAKSQTAKHKAKILREKSTVKLFHSAYSPYLLKYYNCNQNNFQHKNCVLMDYNPYNITLLDHLFLRKESLSTQSKLSILSHISNSIRFLAYYKVVHMDLNLNNILIFDGYLPKIIDFGQSYNREVIQSNFKIPYSPGYTIPYCPPQVFTQKEFTTAQDMYSFGIILFRMLFNSSPLSTSDETIALYKNKVYHQHFYLCPQKLSSMCQERTCFLLLQMINICLKIEQDGRPLPIWSTIVLKEIIANFL